MLLHVVLLHWPSLTQHFNFFTSISHFDFDFILRTYVVGLIIVVQQDRHLNTHQRTRSNESKQAVSVTSWKCGRLQYGQHVDCTATDRKREEDHVFCRSFCFNVLAMLEDDVSILLCFAHLSTMKVISAILLTASTAAAFSPAASSTRCT